MKTELRELVQELEQAFNETVCESDRIASVLADIKSRGYDVLLALDVTIGVTAAETAEKHLDPKPVVESRGELALSTQDEDFLQALHISAA
jgi:hypothetical protein